jgi:hypothetical protein
VRMTVPALASVALVVLLSLDISDNKPRGCLRSPHTVPLASLLSINRIIDK